MEITTLKKLKEQHENGLICLDELNGKRVKVGFLTLTVIEAVTSKNGLICKWLLNDKGKGYEFIPYEGLIRIN